MDVDLLSALLTIWIGAGRFHEAIVRAVSLTQAPYQTFTPLVRLCRGAGRDLYGADPESWSDLLHAIGIAWQGGEDEPQSDRLFVEPAMQDALAASLPCLMRLLLLEDEPALRNALEIYFSVWVELGLLRDGQPLDDFVEQLRT